MLNEEAGHLQVVVGEVMKEQLQRRERKREREREVGGGDGMVKG